MEAVPSYASLRGWKRGGTSVCQGSSSGTTDPVHQSSLMSLRYTLMVILTMMVISVSRLRLESCCL